MTKIKFLIVADLHGEIPKIYDTDFDAILCPGDICGDDLRTYFKVKKNSLQIQGLSSTQIKSYEKLSLQKGNEVLNFLNSFNKPVFLVPGNWDPTLYCDGLKKNSYNKWKRLVRKFKNIHDIENKAIEYKGITLIGHGSTSAPEILDEESLFNLLEEEDENNSLIRRYKYYKKIFSQLNKLFSSTNNPVLFITHNVPNNTTLDLVNYPGSYAHNKHYGSIIAKNLILKYSPLICLGGHIHEGKGTETVNNTFCINAGFGGDINGLLELNLGKKNKINFKFKGKNKV